MQYAIYALQNRPLTFNGNLMNICLYGSGSRKIDEIYTNEVYRLGLAMAQKGHTLVFGGGDTGMMGACARGVHDNNGKSIGIAPEWIGKFEPLWIEPYIIHNVLGKGAYLLEDLEGELLPNPQNALYLKKFYP